MKQDFHVVYAHDKNGFGSISVIGVTILNRREFPNELKRIIKEQEPSLGEIVILNWIKL